MALTAQRVRTSAVLVTAGATIAAALWLRPGAPEPAPVAPTASDDGDGLALSAHLTSHDVLPGDQHLAITITAPAAPHHARPPLAVAIVIDRSGSMAGEPLDHAKAAAEHLVDALDQGDAFSIVTFSTNVETVVPMSTASPVNKQRAHADIERMVATGLTCASCGLDRAESELAAGVTGDRLRRIVFVSDGEANLGVKDRGELVRYAQHIASTGTSITAIGVGLEFDEVTMTGIAEVGHGNYYFVQDTRNLDAMLAKELGGLAATVATGVQLEIPSEPGFVVEDVYGYPSGQVPGGVIVPIADLRAGETRKVVVCVRVSGATGAIAIRGARVHWRGVDGDRGTHSATGAIDGAIADDASQVGETIDRDASRAVEEALSANALERAAQTYETQGLGAAQKVLEDRGRELRAHATAGAIDSGELQTLDAAGSAALDSFAKAPPAAATKSVRETSYKMSR